MYPHCCTPFVVSDVLLLEANTIWFDTNFGITNTKRVLLLKFTLFIRKSYIIEGIFAHLSFSRITLQGLP